MLWVVGVGLGEVDIQLERAERGERCERVRKVGLRERCASAARVSVYCE